MSAAATFLPSSSIAASSTGKAGSWSAAASAPAMTRFANFEPRSADKREAGTQVTRASSAVSAFRSRRPSGPSPANASPSVRSDGSRTTTTSGSVIESCRRIGRSSMRV